MLMLKIILKNKKNIILMYFRVKNILKNNHIFKYTLIFNYIQNEKMIYIV
jgi:hypothetical protein